MAALVGGDGLSSLRGAPLVAAVTSVCSAAFLLFGYEQGAMSGIVISDAWLEKMGHPSDLLVGTITALYAFGALAGAVLAAAVAELLGRKRTLLVGALLVLAGGAATTAAMGRAEFVVGRVLIGIGIGLATSAAPVYEAEMSPAGQRGWRIACALTTMLVGLALAYFINYVLRSEVGDLQWRLPLAFQCAFALFIIAFAVLLPDTPRWLIMHRKSERGISVLARLRNKGVDDPAVRREAADIRSAVELEQADNGRSAPWADLLRADSLHTNRRFYLAVGIQFMQQLSGINIVTYYAPTLYQSSLGMSHETALLWGCLTQVWYVLASFVTWFTIDRIGRRNLFITMALGMCVVLFGEAACIASGTPKAAVGAVVFIFLFEACFTWGWMAGVWVYPPEILPLKVRAKGSALAAAADFFGNFLVVEVTPVGIARLGWRFYLVWAVFNMINAVVVWFLYPETGSLALEDVDSIFTQAVEDDEVIRAAGIQRLQWSRVRIAGEAVRKAREARKRKGWSEESEPGLLEDPEDEAG